MSKKPNKTEEDPLVIVIGIYLGSQPSPFMDGRADMPYPFLWREIEIPVCFGADRECNLHLDASRKIH